MEKSAGAARMLNIANGATLNVTSDLGTSYVRLTKLGRRHRGRDARAYRDCRGGRRRRHAADRAEQQRATGVSNARPLVSVLYTTAYDA